VGISEPEICFRIPRKDEDWSNLPWQTKINDLPCQLTS